MDWPITLVYKRHHSKSLAPQASHCFTTASALTQYENNLEIEVLLLYTVLKGSQ
jgi:hypothetical protein